MNPTDPDVGPASTGPVQRRTTSRRGVIATLGVGAASLAGCLGRVERTGTPETRSFDLTLTDDGGTLRMTTGESGDFEGVLTLTAGMRVTLHVANELDGAVGVHDHVTGETFTVDAGDSTTRQFTVSDDAVGRQKIEGWLIGGRDDADDHHGDHGGHDHGHETDSQAQSQGGAHDESGHDAVVLMVVEVRPAGY